MPSSTCQKSHKMKIESKLSSYKAKSYILKKSKNDKVKKCLSFLEKKNVDLTHAEQIEGVKEIESFLIQQKLEHYIPLFDRYLVFFNDFIKKQTHSEKNNIYYTNLNEFITNLKKSNTNIHYNHLELKKITDIVNWVATSNKTDPEYLKELNPTETDIIEDCPICCSPIEKDESVELPCNHIFHRECVHTWLENNNTCPMCRFTIRPEFIPKTDE